MDGLIALLIIIAAVNAITSSRKKKKAQRQQAQQQAAPQAPAPKAQARIPYTREEWADYLREVKGATPTVKAAAPTALAQAQPAQPTLRAATPRAAEGSVSTQGERPEEHAAHRRRIAQEEEALRREREALRDLRAANTEKLRAAVVMSEVLGKPVALRARTGCRR